MSRLLELCERYFSCSEVSNAKYEVFMSVCETPARTPTELRAKIKVILDEQPRDEDGLLKSSRGGIVEALCDDVIAFLDGNGTCAT
jgi:hypothetical protein